MGGRLFSPLTALRQDTKGITCSVGVVILVKGIVPPATVLFLLGKHDLRVMLIINRPVGFGKKGDAVHGIIMPIEIKIPGIGEVGGMRPRPLSGDVDPTVAEYQTIEPHLENFVGGARVSPDPAGRIAGR